MLRLIFADNLRTIRKQKNISQEELADRALQKAPNAMHISVGNFLDGHKYDEIVLKLKALSQIEPKSQVASEETSSHLEGKNITNRINYEQVKEVDFIHHDQHVGSATMATSLFKDRVKQAGKEVSVKNLDIDELEDSPKHLVIVTKETEKNLKLRYNNIQVISVDDLVNASEYNEIVEHLS